MLVKDEVRTSGPRDPMDDIMRSGVVKRGKELVESLKEDGISVHVVSREGGSLRDQIDEMLRALDEGIHELELKEDRSVPPERKRVSVKLSKLKTVKESLLSLSEIQKKLSDLHGARRTG